MTLFREKWSEIDPDATGFITHDQLLLLLKQIPPPFGFGSMCPRDTAVGILRQLDVNVTADGKVEVRSMQVAHPFNLHVLDAEIIRSCLEYTSGGVWILGLGVWAG